MSTMTDSGSAGSSGPQSALKQGQTIDLTIEKIAAGGHGLAEVEGIPVFVHGAIPGQKLKVVITKKKEKFAEAKIVEILQKAVHEIAPKCKHFWDCGGCVWQHLPYEKQIV